MKVLYDISVVVKWRDVPRGRTGVYRVIENVGRELARAEDCDLTFCIGDMVELSESIWPLEGGAQFLGVPFSVSGLFKLRKALYGGIAGLSGRIDDGAPRGARPLYKAARKFLYHAYQAVEPYAGPISADALARADIFHSPFYPVAEQIRRARKVKKFLTVYDLIPVLHPQYFEAGVIRLVSDILRSLSADDFALCISQATKDDLCNYRRDLDPGRVFVTYPAASPKFHPCSDAGQVAAVREKYGIPPEAPYFLSLCTLEPRKNIDQVVRCFARLVRGQGLKDLRLVLVGTKGWDYDRIFEAISGSGVSGDRIIVTGYVPDEELAPLYSSALAFVYLSFYEGFGLPPLEAMRCGTPVITSNNSALPEVVGDAGIMLDPLDADGICQSMLELYARPSARTELAQKSLRRAGHFSWERCARETIAAYKVALGA